MVNVFDTTVHLYPLYFLCIFLLKCDIEISDAAINTIIYDFDETISKLHMYSILSKLSGYSKEQQLIGLNDHCNDECINKIFGGTDRINRLKQHFYQLTNNDNNINLAILSFGYKDVIIEALKRVNLLRYFDLENIAGREELHFNKRHHIKQHAIKSLFIKYKYKDIPANNRMFIDNDEDNMKYVYDHDVARIFDQGEIVNGLNDSQLLWIENEINKYK